MLYHHVVVGTPAARVVLLAFEMKFWKAAASWKFLAANFSWSMVRRKAARELGDTLYNANSHSSPGRSARPYFPCFRTREKSKGIRENCFFVLEMYPFRTVPYIRQGKYSAKVFLKIRMYFFQSKRNSHRSGNRYSVCKRDFIKIEIGVTWLKKLHSLLKELYEFAFKLLNCSLCIFHLTLTIFNY